MSDSPHTPELNTNPSRLSVDSVAHSNDPETPPSHYVLASEETPRKTPSKYMSIRADAAGPSQPIAEEGDLPSASSSGKSFGSGTSFNDDSILEMLDDEEEEEEDLMNEHDAREPLVEGRRRRWMQDETRMEQTLLQLIPPLILSHPLTLLPVLSLLPYNFLPAGVVFFVPIICVLAILSSCAHIVIVYLAWYLKVPSFEEVFASVAGKHRNVGLWAGRTVTLIAVIGLLTGWLETLYPLMRPAIRHYLPTNSFLQSRQVWTIIGASFLMPSLLPSRLTRNLRNAPLLLTLLLPVVVFVIIGRTVEIHNHAIDVPDEDYEVRDLGVRSVFGLVGGSAGAGMTTLTIFFSPHINTLPIHSLLDRNKRASFPMPCLVASTIILILSIPLALVPYYILPPLSTPLPTVTPITPAGVLHRLPADDAWINIARVLMCAIALGSCNMWILRGRDVLLKSLGVERGDRQRIGRYVGIALWIVVVGFACIGGVFASKVELLGVLAAIVVGWVLPCLFFIVTFHVRSPLAIVFPHNKPAPTSSHNRTDSVQDPSVDALLAKKERQLQKRRLGRRLWQDLIVYVGIMPIGIGTLLWTLGALIGVW